MPIDELVRKRSSWRTYNGVRLTLEDQDAMESYISSDLCPPFGSVLRFRLIDIEPGERRLGTYGFIDGAVNFLAGTVKEGSMDVEDYGYALEKIILYATDMGLGTCWLGGTFNRSGFTDAVGLEDGESMPAISPVGYVKDRRLVGKMMRWAVKSGNRKPWSSLFFKPDLSPIQPSEAGRYSIALEMVRLGPSGSNGQPWRLVVDGDAVHFYVKSKADYEVIRRLDMGIAFCHFELSMEEAGVIGDWSVYDPGIDDGDLKYVATWSS